MKVLILGTGCSKCKKLYEEAATALTQSGVKGEIEKVEKIEDIIKFGVPLTPALVIDGEVKAAGKIPDSSEIVTWLVSAAAKEEEK